MSVLDGSAEAEGIGGQRHGSVAPVVPIDRTRFLLGSLVFAAIAAAVLVAVRVSSGTALHTPLAFALGVAGDVAPETLFDVLSQSGGRSHHFLKRFPNVLAGDYRPGFRMELGERNGPRGRAKARPRRTSVTRIFGACKNACFPARSPSPSTTLRFRTTSAR